MAEKELKPKSFRIDDATAEKIKEISNSIGGNQQETLSKLIEAYELQSGKAVLAEKKADIEQFERYITALTRMYMTSLEDNQNVAETVRTEFDALLKSKDAVIQDLQSQLAAAKQSVLQSTEKVKQHVDEIRSLTDLVENLERELSDMQNMLDDKNQLNKTLTDAFNDAKRQLKELEGIEDRLSGLERLKSQNTSLQGQLERQDIAHQKAMIDFRQQKQNEIEELKKAHFNEIEEYQRRYKELLDESKKTSRTTTRKKKIAAEKTESE